MSSGAMMTIGMSRRVAVTGSCLVTVLLSCIACTRAFQQPAPRRTRTVAVATFSPQRPIGGWSQPQLQGPILKQPLLLLATSTSTDTGGGDSAFFPLAQDLESLQSLFSQYCDKQGLMTRSALRNVPTIAELLVSAFRGFSRGREKGVARSVTIYTQCSRITPTLECRIQLYTLPRPIVDDPPSPLRCRP
jgi:hypothetical protein